jgi:hypothetical protein
MSISNDQQAKQRENLEKTQEKQREQLQRQQDRQKDEEKRRLQEEVNRAHAKSELAKNELLKKENEEKIASLKLNK